MPILGDVAVAMVNTYIAPMVATDSDVCENAPLVRAAIVDNFTSSRRSDRRTSAYDTPVGPGIQGAARKIIVTWMLVV
jgi:hypothetical protein